MSLQQVNVPVEVSKISVQYKERRRKQMMAFFGATATTLLFARLAYRGVQSRRYIPQLFNANHIPPAFSFQRDAILAVTHATCLATSGFAMAITGVCWTWDVSTPKEFGFKVKRLLGGDVNEQKLSEAPMDEESLTVQDAINRIMNGEDITEGLDEELSK
ncbi:uncharacterized protein CYBJADRAFT_165327 [Cyberlindnera jadinii NRRL Y-1542]|nr:hypothetical protein CYBJADRAFT_165327 [Cyberlindnera jadinii NRRL Y-1542]ODV75950.1 hypothetical protein CYBJADRAFT_165327 [Cyberlindnera jadinii NRRL Y-1542]